jgi:hypothetical protein
MQDAITVLPVDFDGIFRFTNWTDEDFITKWDGVKYTFPALKTTPIIIANATPLEIQNIRKKFAKELAEREFFKSPKLRALEGQTPAGSVSSFRMAAIYTEADLIPFIQKCLEPLPVGQVKAEIEPKNDETKLRTDSKGRKVTRVLDKDESLVGDGQVVA